MARGSGSNRKPRFLLHVTGRYESTGPQSETAVTGNLLTGSDEDHFVYAGTFTMTEREWQELVAVMQRGLGSRFQLASGPIAKKRPRATARRTTTRRKSTRRAA